MAALGQDAVAPASQAATSMTENAALAPLSPLVADAEAAIVKSDWKTAEAKLDSWLAAHGNDARSLFDAGYVADAQNRLEDAARLYRRAVAADPQRYEARLSLGMLLARMGKAEEARPELAAATQLDPGEAGLATKARAWRALAEIDRENDAAAASEDLLQALKLSAETPADTLLAAELAERAGQFEAAETAYRRVLAKEPKSAAANAGLAHLLIERKQYPEAESFLRTALELAPDDAVLTAQLATVLAAQDKAEAIPLVEKLHQQHPQNDAITGMLAKLLAQAGDEVASDQLYIALLAAHPDDAALLVGHGQNLVRQLKMAEALTVFDKATKADEANADAWSGLAFAASRTEQPAIALHALTMRSKYLPEVPSTYFLWAACYDKLHQKEQAAAYYHHFLDASAGKFPDQEWQARQRLLVLEKKAQR
jgi:predicted Zn-dependent protease